MSTHCKDPAERRNNPIGILGLLCSTLEKNYVDYVLNLNSKSLMSKHMATNTTNVLKLKGCDKDCVRPHSCI